MNSHLTSNTLIQWYKINARKLPWRDTKDPYKIWLSEIILQQTRVEQGLPYYMNFVEKYPQLDDLANAREEEILRLWQGLGYYSRARNLHKAAQIVAEKFNSFFPNSYIDLLTIKGIGPYTAAAIASFAFDLPHAVVDGNVFRVLSRLFGISTDIASTRGKKEFEQLANSILPEKKAALHNQAIMEFGALQCTPGKPDCINCPLNNNCYAFAHNAQDRLPVKIKKVKVKTRHFNYLLLGKGTQLAMNKRTSNDIWKNMYEFPLVESDKELSTSEMMTEVHKLIGDTNKNVFFRPPHKAPKHILSHQKIFATFWTIETDDQIKIQGPYSYLDLDAIKDLPKPVLINNYLKEFYF